MPESKDDSSTTSATINNPSRSIRHQKNHKVDKTITYMLLCIDLVAGIDDFIQGFETREVPRVLIASVSALGLLGLPFR
jgi:hypothetical protein